MHVFVHVCVSHVFQLICSLIKIYLKRNLTKQIEHFSAECGKEVGTQEEPRIPLVLVGGRVSASATVPEHKNY
jgi:hypothetical protein